MGEDREEQRADSRDADGATEPAERFPVLASIADDMAEFDAEARLRFGLDALIAGLEALSARG